MLKNKTRGETLRNTMIKRYQESNPGISEKQAYDLWRAEMRERASAGGSVAGVVKGFASDPSLASRAGKIGGAAPRKSKKREK